MTIDRHFLLALIVFLTLAAAGEAQSRRKPTKKAADLVRRSAPNFTADAAVRGSAKSLKSLRGRVVLVEFWAVWCPHCLKSYDKLRELQSDYGDQGLDVVGITTYYGQYDFDKKAGRLKRTAKPLNADQERQMVKDFAAYRKMNYRLMMLPRKEWIKTSQAYHATTFPSLFLIDRLGVVRWVRIGTGDYYEALTEQIENLLKEG